MTSRSPANIDSWWLDVKLGVRMLIKYPGLALVGGFGIAVGVAIAAGAFSVIYGSYLASSLPFEEGDRIVSIELWDSGASAPERRLLHDYQSWREGLKSVQEISAFRTATLNLIAPGTQPESVRVAVMSASGFRVPRVQPLIGRYPTEDDEHEGAPAVVVIGESIWRNRFGADRDILGRTIQLGATPHSIVGVMPEGFAFPVNHRFWVPLRALPPAAEPLTGPDLMVFGRLARGATLKSAQAEVAAAGQRTSLAFPKLYAHLRPSVMPYSHPFVGIHMPKDASALQTMNGASTMLLVLVCLNVAILVYTRTAMRQAEISIRTALGATRGRIVVQLFIEALALSTVAAVAGMAIAEFALRQASAATRSIASELPFWLSFHLSPQAALYTAGLSVLAAVIVGVVPALQATRRGVQTGSRITAVGGSGLRLGGIWTLLVVMQVGFAVALLPGAIFSTWQYVSAEFVDPGIAAEEFLTAQLGIDSVRGTVDNREVARRQSELLRRLQSEPRVSTVTFAMAIPGDEQGASIETQAISGTQSGLEVRFNRVDVNFFRAFDVPILAGRDFEASDVAPAGAAESRAGGAIIVNQSFARKIFGGDALGRRVRYVAAQKEEPGRWFEIVGIVRDFPAGVNPGMLDSPGRLYHAIAPGQVQPVNLAIRVRDADPSTFGRRLSDVATAVDPDFHLRNIISLDEALRKEQWIRRMETAVFVAVSLSVLLLSSAGIYALMSFTVSQRRKEIGIRMALGADRTRIVASIFSRALGQLAIGAALGAASAAALERSSENAMMRGNAAIVLPAVALFMMAVGFLAALGPARRCLQIEPTEALREQ